MGSHRLRLLMPLLVLGLVQVLDGVFGATTGRHIHPSSLEQSPNYRDMTAKLIESGRNTPLAKDRDFFAYLWSIFYCLTLGFCHVHPSVQCGLQGVRNRADSVTPMRDYEEYGPKGKFGPNGLLRNASLNGEDRIVAGHNARPAEFPWTAALYLRGSFSCGGSLIQDNWILTAAHCTWGILDPWDTSKYWALLGCEKRSTCTTRYYFSWIWNHPLYIPVQLPLLGIANDVALIRLRDSFTGRFPPNVGPICQPRVMTPPWGFYTLVAMGWGKDSQNGSPTDDLKFAHTTTTPIGTCTWYFLDAQLTYICASPTDGSTCNGDSGSAVASNRYGIWEIDGVVSFGGLLGCANNPIAFKGFANVWLFKNWINFVMLNH